MILNPTNRRWPFSSVSSNSIRRTRRRGRRSARGRTSTASTPMADCRRSIAPKRRSFAHCRLIPNLLDAFKRKMFMAVEKGDLEDAYRDAKELLKRRPENADAHFTMSYMLRYAGLLNESAAECERALAINPTNAGFRSCGITYLLLGNIPRAKQFVQLDAGSTWYRTLMIYILLREGDLDGVLRM